MNSAQHRKVRRMLKREGAGKAVTVKEQLFLQAMYKGVRSNLVVVRGGVILSESRDLTAAELEICA